MAIQSIDQLDMFEGKLFPEFVQSEKIRLLEEKQENLRRGIFRRWNEQEKKMEALSSQLNSILDLLALEESTL